jgi:hypothetical protein
MVRLALQRAKRLAVQDRLSWPTREDGVYKALLGQRLTMGEFVDLDDVAVNHCFKVWAKADDEVLARMCRGLLFRGLYKTVEMSHVRDGGEARRLHERAIEAVRRAGGDASYDQFYDEAGETAYQTFEEGGADGGDGIVVKGVDGRVTRLAEISPLPRALNQRLMFRRIHVSAPYREAVVTAVKGE